MSNFNNKNVKIAINKSLLKEFFKNNERVVYMKPESEFQIQIFNPYSYTVGVSIGINNIEFPNKLIIKPGQRVWLERYLDSARKFLFDTYDVENTNESINAIKNNGIITVKFYKEKYNQPVYNRTWTSYGLSGNYSGDYTYDNFYTVNSPTNITLSSCNTAFYNSAANAVTAAASTANFANTIETGRIERGNHSNQQIENIYIDLESFCFDTEIIHILPYSQKPITKNDLKKIYCTNCGRKINTKYKYCPYCGTKC